MIAAREISLTPAEWEVMRVVWTSGETTSKEINQILNEKMDWKVATTKTLIGRLVKKDLLHAKKDGKRFLYSPLVKEEEVLSEASENLFKRVCQTKRGKLLAEWINDSTLSQSDLDLIEQIVALKKETAPEEVSCECTVGQCDCRH